MSSSSRPAGGFDPQRLIETHQAGVWRYLRALGCDAALADDLTQDTFLRVLQQPFQDYSRAATAAYLRRAAFNLFVSAQRRSGRVVAVEELEAIDNSWARLAAEENGEEMLKSLRECLEQLSQRARSALDMRYRDERSRAEIAAQLSLSEDGAKNLLQRAKERLRECLESKLT
ncbi:MAG: RNA polymerase sigma factor [Pirellulales bacterium]